MLADDACGARIPKSTGGYWACTFSDDFNGSSLDRSKWVPQRTDTSGYMNGPTACFVDSPKNVSVSDGTLRLTAREESAPFDCGGDFTTRYTSGMVSTAQGRFSQTYGRFEVRAKVPPAQVKGCRPLSGYCRSTPPGTGSTRHRAEIDIAEMCSNYPDRAIPFVHYNPAAPDPHVTNTACMISNLAAFHTYALERVRPRDHAVARHYGGRLRASLEVVARGHSAPCPRPGESDRLRRVAAGQAPLSGAEFC
jgi:beta-glucanase (GH16 family)